jgi:drug/metabolite transporter (DMT)-like permease
VNRASPDAVRIDASIIIPFIIFTGVWGSTWIVIRDQIGTVPPQWSVAFRFIIAAFAMALFARLKGQSLKMDRGGMMAALVLGVTQFSVNSTASIWPSGSSRRAWSQPCSPCC